MAFRTHLVGGYTPSEVHVVSHAAHYTPSMAGRVIIYCHGAGGNGYIDGPDIRVDLDRYAEAGHVVHAGLNGGNYVWGNSTCSGSTTAVDGSNVTGAISASLTYLNASWGADITSVMLIGDSMGACAALNWAVRYPTQLGKAMLRVPAISLKTIHDTNVAGLAANMETAYGGSAGLTAAYPKRDGNHPTFQALVASTGIASKLQCMYNASDPIVAQADVLAFATATGVTAVNMGGPSHAPWGYFNINDQYKWLTS